ncbi:MAG: hypothetical protein HN350_17615 [Phycisphaerales bacterium]|jgi:hypothetical protein|nr:hypothetical protein [Phycisphaerales bacterium]
MGMFVLARGRGLGELLRKLFEGDPVAFVILGGAIAFTGLICWLSFYMMKRKGRKLADGIGGCTYKFAPDGLFGRRFFMISGDWENMPFSLESHKTGKKGDHRTVLRIQKTQGAAWAEIQAVLSGSRELVETAHKIAETQDEIVLTYVGVGGDPQLIRTLLGEVASAMGRVCDDA